MNYLSKLKKKLGFSFADQPAKHRVKYSVAVENKGAAKKTAAVVLPVPPDTGYQTLNSLVEFSVSVGAKYSKDLNLDPQYKNSYAVFNLSIKPDQKITIEENFVLTVRPQTNVAEEGRYFVSDYKQDENYLLYTKANRLINTSDPKIQALAKKIIGEEKDVLKIIKNINEYLIANLKYGRPILGLYSALEALENPTVDCGGFSSLFVALANSAGIPARILSGFWAGYQDNQMHAWLELMLPNGTWLPADASIEQLHRQKRTKKIGSLGSLGSDRIVLSQGCDIAVRLADKNYQLDILQNPQLLTDDKSQNDFELTTKFLTN